MPEVLDYSSGWPRAIAPYVGTVRYIGTPGHSKNITKAELDYRLAARVPTAFVHERTAGWMLAGTSAGRSAAQAVAADWAAMGRNLADFPGCYLADDVDTVASQFDEIDACLRGFAETFGAARANVYGEYDVIEHCVGRSARLGWQTRAWSGTNPDGSPRISAKAALYQHVGYVYPDGVQADRNTVQLLDWGQWPMEDDVVTAADVTLIWTRDVASGVATLPAYQALAKAQADAAAAVAQGKALAVQVAAARADLAAQARQIATLSGAVTGLAAAVAAEQQISAAELTTVVQEAIAAAVVAVDVTVHGDPTPVTP
jgi:hypothetical protein